MKSISIMIVYLFALIKQQPFLKFFIDIFFNTRRFSAINLYIFIKQQKIMHLYICFKYITQYIKKLKFSHEIQQVSEFKLSLIIFTLYINFIINSIREKMQNA
jgi:hypothetical protein